MFEKYIAMEKRLVLIGVIGFMLTVFAYRTWMKTKWLQKRHFTTFYTAELQGEISHVKSGLHGVHFKLNNDSTEYIFHPEPSPLNEHTSFLSIAQAGDSVKKASYADTLSFINKKMIYRYHFRKFH